MLETFDGRISASGLRLELRQQAGYELILSGNESPPARVSTAVIPRVADDLPTGPFRLRLAKILGVRALLPMIAVTARETTVTKRDRAGKARVQVTISDQVAVEGHGPLPEACFVEVGEMAGYANDAEKAHDLLRMWDRQPTAADLVEVAAASAGIGLGGFHISPTVPLRRREPAHEAFRRLLANLADTVDATWQGTVDDVDPEFLHDMRIAVRRTRSLLAQGKRVLPAAVRRRHLDGFGWLSTATGRPRDLDVYVIEWDDYLAPLSTEAAAALGPVLDHIARQRRAAHTALSEALRSPRYEELMSGWRAWLAATPADAGDGEAARSIGAVVASRTARAQNRLLARGRLITPSSPAEDLHELRKDAKKLRYLLECFGTLYPSTPRKKFVRLLKTLQDNLGEHQDTDVHVHELRSIPAELQNAPRVAPATLVAIGQLTEQLERRRRAARAEFAGTFAAYDTRDTHRRFQTLLRSLHRGTQ